MDSPVLAVDLDDTLLRAEAAVADRRIAAAVAARVGLFDTVLATDEGRNLKGDPKQGVGIG